MLWRQACINGILMLGLLLTNEAHSYWGYVPIRPVNKIRPLREPNVYGHPGAITLKKDNWEGRDDLAGIPKSLRVVTDVLYSPSDYVWLPMEEAQAELEKELRFCGFDLSPPLAKPDDPFRPFLHLLIFVLPVEQGYAVQVALRLFEKDDAFKRGNLMPHEVWQVITWERQMLCFASRGDLICAVRRDVQSLAEEFTRQWMRSNASKPPKPDAKKTPPQSSCCSNNQWRTDWESSRR